MSERQPLRVGVVGAGAIGSVLCRALDDGTVDAALAGVCEVDDAQAEAVLNDLAHPAPRLDLSSLAEASDIVVEAVSAGFAPQVIEAALAHGADALVLSVGGLLARPDLVDQARAAGRAIHVPTGAVAGLDAVRAAAVAGIDRLTLTTTKPPRGLAGAPGVEGTDLGALTEPTLVFEGSATEAVAAFPRNINVAAALSLAGPGPDAVTVRIVADPTADTNRHAVEVVGAAGEMRFEVDNVPSPENPKTSYLAALSAIALLQRLTSPLAVGS